MFYFYWASLLLITLSVLRSLFYFYHSTLFASADSSLLIKSLLHGIRFDLASVGYLMLPLILLLPILNFSPKSVKTLISKLYFICIFVFTVGLSISDVLYFSHSKRRMGYEAYVYFKNGIFSVFMTGFAESPLLVLLGTLLIGIFSYAILSRPLKKIVPPKYSLLKIAPMFLFFAAINVLIMRGGVQEHIIKMSDTVISPLPVVNALTISSPFQVIKSIDLGRQKPVATPEEKAQALSFLYNNKPMGKDKKYPLHFINDGFDKIKNKKNVVVILFESWDSHYAGPESIIPKATPYFNQLSQEGYYFSSFFSNGVRTTNGLFCTLNGMYDYIGTPLMWKKELQHNYFSISSTLKKQGYVSLFFTGGTLFFDNLKRLLIAEDFDYYMGQEEMAPLYDHTPPSWGFADPYIYKEALKKLKTIKKPWFTYILTTSSHAPNIVPKEYHIFSESDHPEYNLLNSLYYSDNALKGFIEGLKEQNQFENTLFFLVADHSSHKTPSLYLDKKIPFIIYSPKKDLPLVTDEFLKRVKGSQVDISPTIFDILGLKQRAGLGKSLFKKDISRSYALWSSSKSIGMYKDNFNYEYFPENKIEACYENSSPLKDTPVSCNSESHQNNFKLLRGLYQINLDHVLNNTILNPEK